MINRLLTSVATALLLAACSQETDENIPGGGHLQPGDVLRNVTLTLTPEVPQEVETRAPSGIDGGQIRDIYIFQYSSDGNTQLQDPQYFESSNGLTPGTTCKVTLGKLVNQESRIYIVANAYNRMKEDPDVLNTVAKLEAYIYAMANEDYLILNNGVFLTGLFVGKPFVKMDIPLTRAVAKVNFNLSASLPAGHSFALKSTQVKQVPNRLHFVRDNLDATPYPTLTAGQTVDYKLVSYANQDVATTSLNTYWLLPENCRGTGSATTEQQKSAATAPAGQADYCTYIEVKGTYASGHWAGSLDVTYRIYLGSNNTNDYNLRRNTNYTVNTVIKGANRADSRITVTGVQNAAQYLDYTDNFAPWFAVALTDESGSSTLTDWMTGSGTGSDGSRCPAGWRVPTMEELMLIHVYNYGRDIIPTPYNNTDYTPYWAANNQAMILFTDTSTGQTTLNQPLSTKGYIRCIRDL